MPPAQRKLVNITNTHQLVEVLQHILQSQDNDSRRVAEKSLNRFSKKKESILAFLQLLTEHNDASIRQICAVIAKNKISFLWEKLSNQHREHLKSELLKISIMEKIRVVRNSVTQLIAQIAQFELPNKWPNLAPFLNQCVNSQEPSHRELGMMLFGALLEVTSDNLQNLFSVMINVFVSGLKDQNEDVRTAALHATFHLLQSLQNDKQLEQFLVVVEPLIQMLAYYVRQNDPTVEAVDTLFELFTDLSMKDYPQIEQMSHNLALYCIELTGNPQLDTDFRDRAATLLSFLIKYKPNLIIHKNLIDPLITVIIKSAREPEDDDIDDDDITPHRIAQQLLSELALDLPSKFIFHKIADACVKLAELQNPFDRKAAIALLGCMAEGCNELMKANTSTFVPLALKLSTDENSQVRSAACSTLIGFVEYMTPDISIYYKELFPRILMSLDDPDEEVVKNTCYALDSLCESLKPDELTPYLRQYMSKLMQLLQSSGRRMQKAVISTIGAVARAAKLSFVPYFETVINLLKQVMSQKDEANLDLRARATESVGFIAEGVGIEIFGPHVNEFMNLALENFNLPEGHELTENAFHFFGNISVILGEQFKNYLQVVVPLAMKTISQDDGVYEGEEGEFEEEDDYEEDLGQDEEEYHAQFNANSSTAVLDEKSAAVLALGTISKNVGQAFAPYFNQVFEYLFTMSEHYHIPVRRNVMISLHLVLISALPSPVPNQFPQEVREYFDQILDMFISVLQEDDDGETVARVCESLCTICKTVGKVAFTPDHLSRIMESILLLMRNEAACNNDLNVSEEDKDHDIIMIDAASNLIDEMARCLGADFVPAFHQLFPELKRYLKHNAIDDRVMAIGTLAEVCKALQNNCKPFAEEIFQIALQNAFEQHFNIKRNSLFCIGVLAQYAPELVSQQVMKVLQVIQPVFQNRDELERGLVDNACGCLGRLIVFHTENVPLDNVLPVFLSALPLRDDFEENEPVYGAIIKLLETGNSAAANNIQEILRVFAQTLGNRNVSDEIQHSIVNTIKNLNNQVGSEQLRSVFSRLDPSLADKLSRCLQ